MYRRFFKRDSSITLYGMENTQKTLPRDVFLYFLNVIVLAMVAVNLGVLLFQFVNVYVPDVLQDRYSYPGNYDGAIRWAVATLVIVFPVFVWVTRFLKRDIAANPEKKELKIRRWLLYLTLFVAGLVIIGDAIALVYNFLEGELTLRFFLKILVIMAIASKVFFYYLNTLRDQRPKALRMLERFTMAVVAVAVVAGLLIAGLPQNRRLARLDEQRIYDLQNIQSQVISFWQSKNRLPNNLDELRNDISGFTVPTDPETRQTYKYVTKGKLQFELCATFKTDASQIDSNVPKAVPAGSVYGENWTHGVGEVCFERTIDPEIYQIPGKPILR